MTAGNQWQARLAQQGRWGREERVTSGMERNGRELEVAEQMRGKCAGISKERVGDFGC